MNEPQRALPEDVPADGAPESVACADCGLGQRLPPVPPGFLAECMRCGSAFARPQRRGLDAPLALAAAALLLWLPACNATLLIVSASGAQRTATLTSGVTALWLGGFPSLALVVAAFSIVVPWSYLALLTYILARIRFARLFERASRPRSLGRLYRWTRQLRPWMMMEVYLIGCCVAYSRIQKVAFVSVGTAGWCLFAATLLLLSAVAALDEHRIWQALPLAAAEHTNRSSSSRQPAAACRVCEYVSSLVREGDRCPRCGARLHARVPASLLRTTALVVCGFLLYIPANLLPVLAIERYGREDPNTILGGVLELIQYGLWPLAAIVFTASILIPLAKLFALSGNLLLTRRRSARWLAPRTRLHRAIDAVGRWSNIDVFMVSVLVALVQFGALTSVRVQDGMVAFAAVVIVTMAAAKSFDTRLMWDAAAGGAV